MRYNLWHYFLELEANISIACNQLTISLPVLLSILLEFILLRTLSQTISGPVIHIHCYNGLFIDLDGNTHTIYKMLMAYDRNVRDDLTTTRAILT